jgi:hypothetical protein
MSPRRIAVVPHTHWDREWYEPFQGFRLRLVKLLDRLLALMEHDPSYARFLLDGQMAVVDDYLEIRPEAEERIRALAAAGRLTMGPWYILMDEFLVSGETIVRNLQLGIARGAAFGGVMSVGYLPDMFGHIAQMPQILRQAGFSHTAVWRGVPSRVDKTGFWWEAPDGSRVRAEYLVVGYGNGAAIPDDPKALVRRVKDHVAEVEEFLIDDLLFMNGTDHQEPQPWLGRVLAEANALQDELQFEITSLADYVATAPNEDLPLWQGELRSGARSNVLMGVASNRVDVKQAAARTERALERRAEPYTALFVPSDAWPHRLLALAWLGVIRNSAHDSICACSVQEVIDAVLHRFAESRRIADGLANQALEALGRSMAKGGPVVVNASARARRGLVELVVPATGDTENIQVLAERIGPGLPGTLTIDAQTVRTILGAIQGSRIDDDTWVQGVTIAEDEDGIDLTITLGPEENTEVPIASIRQDLYTRLGARPTTMVRVRLDQPPLRRILARAETTPGFGWQAFRPAPLSHPVEVLDRDKDPASPVTLGNGLVTVDVNPADGTFSIDGLPGFGRLVDGGDLGDSYNYSPPGTDTLVDTPDSCQVTIGDRGPVRATVTIVQTYTWPEYVDGTTRRRVGVRTVEVTTVLELRADDPAVHLTTRFVNPSRDHRLRVHFPLPEPADHSEAECAFSVVSRGLTAEGRSDEYGLPTFPSRRFVTAGGLTVAHEGLLEYELVDLTTGDDGTDRAHGLALTLLRATGMLSRLGMTYRPLPAGPLTPVEGLQLLGHPLCLRYSLARHCTDPYALVDDAFLPLDVVQSFGGGTRPESGSALEITGAQVSAVQRVAGVLEVRVFNPTNAPTTVSFPNRAGWLVDLRGAPITFVEGSFELGTFAFATLRLTD